MRSWPLGPVTLDWYHSSVFPSTSNLPAQQGWLHQVPSLLPHKCIFPCRAASAFLRWPGRSQQCQESMGPALPVLPRSWYTTSAVGCHSPAAAPALSWQPATCMEPWNSTQATCTGLERGQIPDTWHSPSFLCPNLSCSTKSAVGNPTREPKTRFELFSKLTGKKQGLVSTKHSTSYPQGWIMMLQELGKHS